ncbi:hypothetical protein M1446_03565 [Candidatus Dependentiae bacterium]|nr:hypothetical protein [Candidatus Dependentiae bacterium]
MLKIKTLICFTLFTNIVSADRSVQKKAKEIIAETKIQKISKDIKVRAKDFKTKIEQGANWSKKHKIKLISGSAITAAAIIYAIGFNKTRQNQKLTNKQAKIIAPIEGLSIIGEKIHGYNKSIFHAINDTAKYVFDLTNDSMLICYGKTLRGVLRLLNYGFDLGIEVDGSN